MPHGADDTALLIDGPRPAAGAFVRFREKLIGHALEFLAGQIPGAGTVILAEIGVFRVGKLQMAGDHASGVRRIALGTRMGRADTLKARPRKRLTQAREPAFG